MKSTLLLIFTLLSHDVLAFSTKGACGLDVQRFCQNIQPGGFRLTKCLASHETQLSASCQIDLSIDKERSLKSSGRCDTDIQKVCAGIEIGKGRVYNCLVMNEAALDHVCSKAMKSIFASKDASASIPFSRLVPKASTSY